MIPGESRPLRVLILCTGNSARSQMAEAVLNRRGRGRVIAESAGSEPAARVNPYAIEALRNAGIEWQGHQPRGLTVVEEQSWDIVITVCDHAKEACPFFPGQPVVAHWGMKDPARVEGKEDTKRRAFRETLELISRRVDLLLALPVERLQGGTLQQLLKTIGEEGSGAPTGS
jgi:arsenate reductase